MGAKLGRLGLVVVVLATLGLSTACEDEDATPAATAVEVAADGVR
jgi:hypothetical protein